MNGRKTKDEEIKCNKVPFSRAMPASVARSGKVAGSSPCFSNTCCTTERVRSTMTSDRFLEK